jgi:hypothetical protein
MTTNKDLESLLVGFLSAEPKRPDPIKTPKGKVAPDRLDRTERGTRQEAVRRMLDRKSFNCECDSSLYKYAKANYRLFGFRTISNFLEDMLVRGAMASGYRPEE